jgi:SAM-dependent methyltransferase
MPDTEATSERRRRTGQFFTPPEVARFLVELLHELAPELTTTPPRSVIDPACGTGTFLEAVLEVVDPAPARLVGVDLFPQEGELWGDGGGGREQVVDDGLLAPTGEQFDLVVGNPPYHGDGLRCLADLAGGGGGPQQERAERLAAALAADYTLWRRTVRDPARETSGQLSLLGGDDQAPPLAAPVLDQLSRYPVELAFLDRFVQLCRPGGHVVIVMPEGVAANRSMQPARNWVQGQCQLLGVIGLPRGTFRGSGTSAATVTLLLRKRAESDPRGTGQTLLQTVERLDRLDGALDALRQARREGGGDEA